MAVAAVQVGRPAEPKVLGGAARPEPDGCELPSLPSPPARLISGSEYIAVPIFDVVSKYLQPTRFISGSHFIPIFFTAEDIASYLCAPKVVAARRGLSASQPR